MEFLNKKTIKLDKELNELDKFVFKFLKTLEKHTKYVIVGGYIAILLGRNRGTEDIDIIIPKMSKFNFQSFYDDMIKNNFWCLNSGDVNEIYGLLTAKHAARFAIKQRIAPNIELKFSKNDIDEEALNSIITVKIGKKALIISALELFIAYKEEVLKSDKDMEDAEYVKIVVKEHLNNRLLDDYKKRLR